LEGSGWSIVDCGLAGYNWPDHDQQRSSRFLPTVKPGAVITGQTTTNNAAAASCQR